ncbi:hypothetical protein AAC387_Pa01g0280 [Persea americana]
MYGTNRAYQQNRDAIWEWQLRSHGHLLYVMFCFFCAINALRFHNLAEAHLGSALSSSVRPPYAEWNKQCFFCSLLKEFI